MKYIENPKETRGSQYEDIGIKQTYIKSHVCPAASINVSDFPYPADSETVYKYFNQYKGYV